jgi:positive regulator of sigma E activity
MNPALKNVAAIPYVSRNPAISFPLLIIGLVLAYLLAKSYLKGTQDKEIFQMSLSA